MLFDNDIQEVTVINVSYGFVQIKFGGVAGNRTPVRRKSPHSIYSLGRFVNPNPPNLPRANKGWQLIFVQLPLPRSQLIALSCAYPMPRRERMGRRARPRYAEPYVGCLIKQEQRTRNGCWASRVWQFCQLLFFGIKVYQTTASVRWRFPRQNQYGPRTICLFVC